MPPGYAKSSIAVHTAPDWAISASLPGSTGTSETVALSPMSVRITPNAPGPASRMPCFAAIAATSFDQRLASAWSPAGAEVSRTAAFALARAASSSTPGTAPQGTAITTSSTGFPIA